jgi:hypothetical protein
LSEKNESQKIYSCEYKPKSYINAGESEQEEKNNFLGDGTVQTSYSLEEEEVGFLVLKYCTKCIQNNFRKVKNMYALN